MPLTSSAEGQLVEETWQSAITLRIKVCPKKGINLAILLSGWDWDQINPTGGTDSQGKCPLHARKGSFRDHYCIALLYIHVFTCFKGHKISLSSALFLATCFSSCTKPRKIRTYTDQFC